MHVIANLTTLPGLSLQKEYFIVCTIFLWHAVSEKRSRMRGLAIIYIYIYIYIYIVTNFADKRRSLGQYSSLADYSLGVFFILSRVRCSVTNNNAFWIGWLDLLAPSITITLNYSQLEQPKSMTTLDSPHSAGLLVFYLPLCLIYQSVTSSASVVRWLTLHS
jgi:hypothetical protein